jgi:hypothetical protein
MVTAVRPEKDSVPVKIEELFLAAGETSDIGNVCSVDAHSLERWAVGYWRNYEVSIVLKADETAIEKMIDAGRE